MRIDEVEKRLRALGIEEAQLPINTVRRWSAAKLLPKPESIYHSPEGGPGRYGEWPPETVEQAAATHMARSSISTATIGRVKLTTLMQAKRLVDEFYAIVDEFNKTGDAQVLIKFETMLTPVELPDGKRGVLFGDWDLNTLVITWIASLEKVRHGMRLFEPMTVWFNWNVHLVRESGREDLKMKFDGVTFEPSDKNAVARRVGHTQEAMAKRLGPEPANWKGELRRDATIFDKDTQWECVQIDTDRQLVIVTRPEREDTVIIDMRGTGFKICSEDARARKGVV